MNGWRFTVVAGLTPNRNSGLSVGMLWTLGCCETVFKRKGCEEGRYV